MKIELKQIEKPPATNFEFFHGLAIGDIFIEKRDPSILRYKDNEVSYRAISLVAGRIYYYNVKELYGLGELAEVSRLTVEV